MMIGSPTRPGFHTVTPYLLVRHVEPIRAFVERAFDGKARFSTTGAAGGTHLEMQIGDSMIMIGGDVPGGMEPKPAALFELDVRNDVADASTSLRMRSTVERRFVEALGERLRRESGKALTRLSDVLVVPPAR